MSMKSCRHLASERSDYALDQPSGRSADDPSWTGPSRRTRLLENSDDLSGMRQKRNIFRRTTFRLQETGRKSAVCSIVAWQKFFRRAGEERPSFTGAERCRPAIDGSRSNCRLDIAQRLRPRGRQSAATVEQLVATVLHFVETVLHVVATVEQLLDTLLQDVATVEQVVATVEQVGATVEHAVATVEHLVETVEHVVATVEHVAATVPAWRSKVPVVPGLVRSQPTGCAGREASSSSLNEARKSASRQARITRAAGSSSLPPWFPACSKGTSRYPLAKARGLIPVLCSKTRPWHEVKYNNYRRVIVAYRLHRSRTRYTGCPDRARTS